jgi:hypothetical protein
VVQQPAVRFGTALEPARVPEVVEPSFAASLRGAYGAALGLPIEAVLVAGVFDVRTGAVTTFLSTDDVNVAGNSEDAAAVLDGLLGGAQAGRRRRRQRRLLKEDAPWRALQAPAAAPNALSISGLAPRRNTSSSAVAVFFNALAPCAPPCSDAQNAAAAAALRARVLATGGNASLLADVLPPGMEWALNGAVVIPFSMPRVRIKWRLLAWLASLPSWVIAVSATAGALVCAVAMALLWRRVCRSRNGKVSPEEVLLEGAGVRAHSTEPGARRRSMRSAVGDGGPFHYAPLRSSRGASGGSRLGGRPTPPASHPRMAWEPSATWEDEFYQQAAPTGAARGLRAPAGRGRVAPLAPAAPTPRWAASPQLAAGAEALRAPLPQRAPGLRSPSQQHAASLTARARAVAAAKAALAAAEAEEAEAAALYESTAAEEEQGGADEEEGGLEEEEEEAAGEEGSGETDEGDSHGWPSEAHPGHGSASPSRSRRARQGLAQLAPLRRTGPTVHESSLESASNVAKLSKELALRALKGRLGAAQRVQQRGGAATSSAHTRSQEGWAAPY